ncbi:hypothetical protein LTR56_020759 [Elasticomyces elasticus]|nr:hypothetical protein LTR56_020759 [Elasticomyces elasticus]
MQDDVYSTSLDSTRHSKAAYLHWIGGLFFDQNKIQEAEELYSRALRAKEEAWGPKDTSTISIVNNLAILYEEQGKTQAAEEMYLRAIRGHERALGRNKMQEAEATYPRVVRGFENVWAQNTMPALDSV